MPAVRLPLKRILISAGGLGYEVDAENLALQVATVNRADVTILHVIPPTELDYPTTRDVTRAAEDLQDTDTMLGRSLRKGLEIAQRGRVECKVDHASGASLWRKFWLRSGMGIMIWSAWVHATARHALRQLYTPNVTAEVAEAAHCPVLTVRHMPK